MSTTTTQPKQVTAPTLYKRLQSQLDGSFFGPALKTVDRLLRLNPADRLAAHTRIQLLIALDQFPTALESIKSPAKEETTLEEVYCLYKTGREKEALAGLGDLPAEVSESRAAKLLEAQINYRLERFDVGRDLYEDLIATAEPDAPELIDLQTNLDACQSALNFLSSLPSTIANSTIPPLDQLESQPIGPLLASLAKPKSKASAPRPIASTSTLPAAPADGAATRAPRGKLPKNYDASRAKGKGPDPDRWVPYRERPGMAEIIVAKREKARGRNKELTQGGPVDEGAKAKAGAGAASKAGGGGGKKKKGKK